MFFIQYTYMAFSTAKFAPHCHVGVSPCVFMTWEHAAAYAARHYSGMRDIRILPTKG
jgi:hypothetical protein